VSWLKAVITVLSPRRRPVFDTRTFSVNFVVQAVTQAQGSRCLSRFSRVRIILSVLHSYLLLNITVIRRRNGRIMGNLKNWGAEERKFLSHLLVILVPNGRTPCKGENLSQGFYLRRLSISTV